MNAENEPLLELQHIKKMMERSTKFSSLSGLSSVAAGICGLTGIWFVVKAIAGWKQNYTGNTNAPRDELATQLLFIAVATFIAALISSFIFIYLRCKKLGIPVCLECQHCHSFICKEPVYISVNNFRCIHTNPSCMFNILWSCISKCIEIYFK